MSKIVRVCIPHTGRDGYDYTVGDEMEASIGSRVWVTLRGRKYVGIVIEKLEQSAFEAKLKPVVSVVDALAILDTHLLSFYRWIGQYYHAPLSGVLNFALPKQVKEGKPILDRRLGLGPTHHVSTHESVILNPEQHTAVEGILAASSQFHCFLLQGVTGSGKTEVYLRVIESVLAKGMQVLVLVPEIGLTPQLVSRFRERLHTPIEVIHSHLNHTERYKAWCAGATGQAGVILGTRSALFTPLPTLGLIVIDEEHDLSFKQQDRVRYSARDCALVRAKQLNIPVILGSATPSLETYYHALCQKYTCFKLTQKALTSAPLHYELVDLRIHALKEGLTEKTYQKIEQHLSMGNQVLVFVNRRGYAPVLLCHDCGWMADCTACDRHFTVHKKWNRMICHHCGTQLSMLTQCGHCQSRALLCVGSGTQRLFQALVKRFPAVNTAQIDRDELRKKHALEAALNQIAAGQIQLMVGTQLLAKGHHFPKLTLVVIADTDAGLYHQDFRSMERLGQLILQVSGRAGRADLPGEVLLQTHFPTHPLLLILLQQGYDAFAQALLAQRASASLPPYAHVSLIRAQGRDADKVEACLLLFKQQLLSHDILLYGPAPALMFKKAGLYRMQLCLMSASRPKLHQAINQVVVTMESVRHAGVKWVVDVDPVES